MSAPVVLTVATVAVVTLLALTLLVAALVRRLKLLVTTLAELETRLAPTLTAVGREAVVAQQQLERVAALGRAGQRQPLGEARRVHSDPDG